MDNAQNVRFCFPLQRESHRIHHLKIIDRLGALALENDLTLFVPFESIAIFSFEFANIIKWYSIPLERFFSSPCFQNPIRSTLKSLAKMHLS